MVHGLRAFYRRVSVLLFVGSVPDFMTERDCFVAALIAMAGTSSVIASEAKQSAPTKICPESSYTNAFSST